MSMPSPTNPTPRWVWFLLAGWLVYTFAALAWFILNDPALMGSICWAR